MLNIYEWSNEQLIAEFETRSRLKLYDAMFEMIKEEILNRMK